jgi:zinc transport system substrate-binding protein
MNRIKTSLSWLILCLVAVVGTSLSFSISSYAEAVPSSSAKQMDATDKVPKVVASIPPFYLLTATLMEGVGKPILLVKPGASPHDYNLKPSEVKTLNNADLIIWGGPELETFLMSPVKNLSQNPKIHILELDKTEGLSFLPLRAEFANETHSHDHGNHDHDASHQHAHANPVNDMHFWLDPKHAPLLADSIVKSLSDVDPAHADIYKQNGEKFKQQMQKVDKDIRAKLKPVQNVPYLVFHDAYRYFEKQYGLHGVGAVTLHPELPPSAKRLLAMQKLIKTENVRCVFTEPQFPDKMVKRLIEGTDIGSASIDPLGSEYLNQTDGYVKMFEGLSNSIEACLKRSPR